MKNKDLIKFYIHPEGWKFAFIFLSITFYIINLFANSIYRVFINTFYIMVLETLKKDPKTQTILLALLMVGSA